MWHQWLAEISIGNDVLCVLVLSQKISYKNLQETPCGLPVWRSSGMSFVSSNCYLWSTYFIFMLHPVQCYIISWYIKSTAHANIRWGDENMRLKMQIILYLIITRSLQKSVFLKDQDYTLPFTLKLLNYDWNTILIFYNETLISLVKTYGLYMTVCMFAACTCISYHLKPEHVSCVSAWS